MARYGVLIAFLIGMPFCLEALGKYILFYHLYKTSVIFLSFLQVQELTLRVQSVKHPGCAHVHEIYLLNNNKNKE